MQREFRISVVLMIDLNSNLDKGHRKGVDITFKCEWAARVRNWLKVFLRTHDFRCCPSARTRSLEGCEFRWLDQK